jgi:hypothetical protein
VRRGRAEFAGAEVGRLAREPVADVGNRSTGVRPYLYLYLCVEPVPTAPDGSRSGSANNSANVAQPLPAMDMN